MTIQESPVYRPVIAVFFLVFVLAQCHDTVAFEPPPESDVAQFFPATTVSFAEIKNAPAVLDAVLKHDIVAKAWKLDAYQKALKSPDFIKLNIALVFVEAKLGMTWQEAITATTHGGVFLAVDSATNGGALLFEATDEETLELITSTFVDLARKDAKDKGKPDPFRQSTYRDLDIYGTKNGGGFTTIGKRLLITNKSELGKTVIDAMLDGQENSLATQKWFVSARQTRQKNAAIWNAFNTSAIKSAVSNQSDNPGVEAIAGGLAEALKTTDKEYATAAFYGEADGLKVVVDLPFNRTNVSETREFFFGPHGTGTAKPTRNVPGQLLSISAYRNLSEMWLRAGDLFDEKTNDKISEADSNLSTLFSGKDFGEEILGAIEPQLQIAAARQDFSKIRPVPSIKLPAFALVAELKEPETSRREFRRIFQSLIGFFNVVGAMNRQPQFELDFESLKNGELLIANIVPEDDEKDSLNAKINFNFSPSIAFHGQTMVISSTAALARNIATAPEASEAGIAPLQVENTAIELKTNVLKQVLEDNKSLLISQNMLKEGHSRDEAQFEIETLLGLISLFDHASMKLASTENAIQLSFALRFAKSVTEKGDGHERPE